MSHPDHIIDYIHDTSYADLPPKVRHMALLCTLDLVGSLCGGRQTRLSTIIRQHAVEVYGGNQASLLFDGRRCSAPGAALANGMTIDSLDIHDSHREGMGHAGVHVFSALVAVAQQLQAAGQGCRTGQEFVTTLVLGYDVAIRAALALHGTVCDYHTSGAWGAVSSAALYSRLHGLNRQQTRHALGIAEYHGPRSQMMRCIDHPTMLKDGSGWGAMAGVSAGMLAAGGFTGAPAITVEATNVAGYWQDLGQRWMIMDQGFKVHAVCWWAQPAIEATLQLLQGHKLAVPEIDSIEIETFEKATHLDHPRPATSEEAQYSLPYPVASALWAWAEHSDGWFGLGPAQLLEDYLTDERVLQLTERITLVEASDLTARFPDKFLARATIITRDGRTYHSADTTFRGELDFPLTETDLRAKYRWLAEGLLPPERVAALEKLIFELPELDTIQPLLDLLTPPPDAKF